MILHIIVECVLSDLKHTVCVYACAEDIKNIFVCFGSLIVDWPHKLQTKACVPPKGELPDVVRYELISSPHNSGFVDKDWAGVLYHM